MQDAHEHELDNLLVAQSPDATIFASTDGCIRSWNPAAEKLFGFTAVAAIGQRLDIIIPEQLRAAHWRGFDAAIASGHTQHHGKALPTKAICADGSQIYVEMSFGIIVDAKGEVLGSVAQARDINERYLRERAERARLKELEQILSGKTV